MVRQMSLSARFLRWTKVVALVELSLAFLPAMIFIGVLVQEIQPIISPMFDRLFDFLG